MRYASLDSPNFSEPNEPKIIKDGTDCLKIFSKSMYLRNLTYRNQNRTDFDNFCITSL